MTGRAGASAGAPMDAEGPELATAAVTTAAVTTAAVTTLAPDAGPDAVLDAVLVLGVAPDAVPRARRFARAAVAGQSAELADDVASAVTELVTNAVLHGAGPVTLRVRQRDGWVRIEVDDRGGQLPVPAGRSAGMTGRGLLVVSALSRRWGTDPRPDGGKVVWAELGAAVDPGEAGLRSVDPGVGDRRPELDAPAEPLYTVRLGAVSTSLLLAAKEHLDNVGRELTLHRLRSESDGQRDPVDVAALVETLTRGFASAREDIKRQALAAAERGDEETELVLVQPASAADAGDAYLAALDEIDHYARAARLLTLEPPPLHRAFRHWYVQGLVDQIRAQADGRPVPRLRTFQQVLAAEVARLGRLEDSAFQLELLQRVTRQLVGALTLAEIAGTVTEVAVEELGASSARAFVLEAGGVLRSVGFSGDSASAADGYQQLRLEDDLPGPEALRTGQPVVLHNRAEIGRRYPSLATVYPDERALHVAPLVVGEHRLGVLALTFQVHGALPEDSQGPFVTALADALAQALERSLALTRAAEANERLSFLADASLALSGTLDHGQTIEAVTRLLVPRLADWCVVQVLDGSELRTAGLLHFDPAKVTFAERMAGRYPTRMDAPAGAPNVIRTGRSELFPQLPAELVESSAVDQEHLEIIRQLGLSSAVVVPLTGRLGTFGAITLIYAESGRRYSQADLPFVEDVARRAALALENARVFSEQADRLADVRQVNARLSLLSALSADLAGAASREEVLQRLSEAAVTAMADWVTVIVPGSGGLVRVAAAAREPALGALAKRLVGTYPHAFTDSSPGAAVYRSGEPMRVDRLASHIIRELDSSSASAAYGRTLHLLGDGPGLLVPIRSEHAVLAVVTLCRRTGPSFTDADVEVMTEVAQRVAARLAEAQQLETQRQTAAALQNAALPKSLPSTRWLGLAAGYRPASEGGQVGGDWYDAVEMPGGRVVLVVGDAAGHGLQAAAVMAQLRNGLRAHLTAGQGPSQALESLSSFVVQHEPDVFATIVCAEVDPIHRAVRWASAGHPAPVLVDRGGASRHLADDTGPPIGWAGGEPPPEHTMVLAAGTRLLMFSDGLVERRGVDLDIGLTHLLFVAEQTRGNTADGACGAILAEMLGGAHEDDVCLLVADFAAEPAPDAAAEPATA